MMEGSKVCLKYGPKHFIGVGSNTKTIYVSAYLIDLFSHERAFESKYHFNCSREICEEVTA